MANYYVEKITYDGNTYNIEQIRKTLGTAKGDIIYFSEASTPVRLAIGSAGQALRVSNGVPVWENDAAITTEEIDDICV